LEVTIMVREASSRDVVPGFGERVRELREARGWTQEQLAERANTHFTTVSKVERGDRAASLRLALVLAEAFGVSVMRLVPADWRKRAEGAAAQPSRGTKGKK
jgi:transcriptional regulator with XRE-family HTH domain